LFLLGGALVPIFAISPFFYFASPTMGYFYPFATQRSNFTNRSVFLTCHSSFSRFILECRLLSSFSYPCPFFRAYFHLQAVSVAWPKDCLPCSMSHSSTRSFIHVPPKAEWFSDFPYPHVMEYALIFFLAFLFFSIVKCGFIPIYVFP